MWKEWSFQQKLLKKLDIHMEEKKELNLVTYTKINSKCITELNIRAKLRNVLKKSKDL